MQERQVTLADTTFRLDDPFWVLATQNPVEHEGVYPLPEAQLDRFSMMLSVDYPAAEHELHMLQVNFQRVELERQVSPSDVAQMRDLIRAHVHISDRVREYIVRIGRATRDPGDVGLPNLKELLVLGVSPRSYQHILALVRVEGVLPRPRHTSCRRTSRKSITTPTGTASCAASGLRPRTSRPTHS